MWNFRPPTKTYGIKSAFSQDPKVIHTHTLHSENLCCSEVALEIFCKIESSCKSFPGFIPKQGTLNLRR
jgi:hypothetical protein